MARRSSEQICELAVTAATRCFHDIGIARTTIDDVVSASGVARATLYRHVGGRDELLLAVVRREIDDLRAALLRRIGATTSIVDLLIEGVLHAVDLVHDSAVLSELLREPGLLASEVSGPALDDLMRRLHEVVGPLLDHGGARIRADLDPAIAVEVLVRTIASLVALRVRDEPDREDRRRYLRHALVPVFLTDAGTDQR